MEHPRVDPHGDPIPTGGGEIDETAFEPLAGRAAGDELIIVRVTDQDMKFLHFAEREGLVPGTRVRVDRRDDDADALAITVGAGRSLTLGAAAAAKILVATGQN
jgi:DtxR family Mn-dependent transcriptional regulator